MIKAHQVLEEKFAKGYDLYAQKPRLGWTIMDVVYSHVTVCFM